MLLKYTNNTLCPGYCEIFLTLFYTEIQRNWEPRMLTHTVADMEESIGQFYCVPGSPRRGLRGLLINRSGRPRNVAQSLSLLNSDDVCSGRDDCLSDACLLQLRADRKAIYVQPPIRHPTANSNWKGRKRPVGCHIGSMLVLAEFRRSSFLSDSQRSLENTKCERNHSWNLFIALHYWMDEKAVQTHKVQLQ